MNAEGWSEGKITGAGPHLLSFSSAQQLVELGQLADLPHHLRNLAAKGLLHIRPVHQRVVCHIMQQGDLQRELDAAAIHLDKVREADCEATVGVRTEDVTVSTGSS